MVRSLPIYVINLARRPDRLAVIAERLAAAGLSFERIDAVDAQSTPDEAIDPHFSAGSGFGRVAKGDRCCTLSHLRFFERLVASRDDYALVLEDDAVFDGAALRRVLDTNWLPPEVDLVKIEAYGGVGRKILVGPQQRCLPGLSIARLHSRHTGTGGYIISRALAAWLLSEAKPLSVPIDHLLFNPQLSPVFERIRPYQLLPTLVRQFDFKVDSDIDHWRIPYRQFSVEFVKRELWRFATDVRALPQQVAQLAFGNWRFVSV